MWFSKAKNGRLLWTRWWTWGFRKVRENLLTVWQIISSSRRTLHNGDKLFRMSISKHSHLLVNRTEVILTAEFPSYKYTMMYQSNTTKLYYVYYYNTIINIIKFCCVWLIHHCIFIYMLNTSGWQILKMNSLRLFAISDSILMFLLYSKWISMFLSMAS